MPQPTCPALSVPTCRLAAPSEPACHLSHCTRHCLSLVCALQRSLRGGVAYGDPLFRLASALGSIIWRSALLVLAGLRRLAPTRFPADYVEQQVGDARQGYNEVLKIMVRFAVVPVLTLLGMIAAGLKVAAATGRIAL